MGSVLLQVYLTIALVFSYGNCDPCARVESLDISVGVIVTENGSMIHNGVEYGMGEWYEAEEDGVQKRFGCPCIRRTCLWKCCGGGEAFLNKTCNATEITEVNPFNPPVFEGQKQLNISAHEHFFYMYNQLCIEDRYLVDPSLSSEELYIQQVEFFKLPKPEG